MGFRPDLLPDGHLSAVCSPEFETNQVSATSVDDLNQRRENLDV
jgi:hypothetical protein